VTTLRVRTGDIEWYGQYIDKMVQEARDGFHPAIDRLRIHVVRFAGMSNAEIANGEPTREDGQLVYAREHGFQSWGEMADYAERMRKGEVNDSYGTFVYAIEGKDPETVQDLLKSDPGLVHEGGSNSKTPLHCTPDVRVIRILLEHGAPVEKEALGAGGTALVHALHWGWAEKAELLAEHSLAPANLRVAAGLGRMDLAEAMFEEDGSLTPDAGANREFYRPNYGWFPWAPSDDPQEVLDEGLSYAARNGRIEAMEYLKARGADLNAVTYLAPPIHYTVWRGLMEALLWLVDNGADVNALGSFGGHARGVTALHLAASDGSLDIVKYLISQGVDVTVKDELYGGDALGWAQHFKRPEMVDYLKTVPGLGG
jgi:hypothetical protein